ncbi:P-loop containing nucleoside triphosphate hydrolase protein, partial [Pavlovales sp. CCMP2436]
QGVLLSGPPGTGKTMLAKAVATESGAAFINISMSEITSKWYGEDEKYVAAIFRVARRIAPCVIFLDEIDSLLGRRGSAFEHEATRRLRNEFLSQWDGLLSGSPSQRVLVLGATNRPFDLDEAALRRLPRRLALSLPDADARVQIFKVLLAEELGTSKGGALDLSYLASITDGYSGSDLKHLCTTAALEPIRDLLRTATAGEQAAPLKPEDLRPLAHADFDNARARAKPSVSAQVEATRELNKWQRQFAEGAGANPSTAEPTIGF